MNSKEITAYKCEKCGKAYIDKSFADKCCEPKHCKDCGCELSPKWYRTVCDSCQSKREFNRGVVLTMDEFLRSEYKDNMVCHNDRYYMDIDECLESILDGEVEVDDVKYLKATNKYLHKLDSDNLICGLEEECNCEDEVYVDKQGVKELEDFLKVWNDKYHLTTYGEANAYIKVDDYIKEERANNGH